MISSFYGARLKIERAKQHINDLQRLSQEFADTHPHIVNIESDPNTGSDRLSIVPAEQFPDTFLLILGDAFHNLRSALDHAWFQMVTSDPKYRKFPVRETREGVEAAVNGLKECACDDIKRFIVDVVQPYRGGNGEHILALHDLDIADKHSLLIAHRQFTRVRGMTAKDEKGEDFTIPDWLIVPPYTESEPFEGHKHFHITNCGDARTHVALGEGMPLQGHYIMPTLLNLTKLVARLVDCFETIHIANSAGCVRAITDHSVIRL